MVTQLFPMFAPMLAVNWLLIGGSLFTLLAVVGLIFWLTRSLATTEAGVQQVVHAMEEGSWVSKLRFILLLAGICAVYSIFIFAQFRGLSHSKAMDQAQVARELARGNGFSTKFIRPAGLRQFQMNKGGIPEGNIPDTYNAPLNPLVNSVFLRFTKSTWQMTPKDLVYTSDRVIAAFSMLFFLLSVGVNYCIAKRLFDRRLALLGMGLVLVADTFWQFSLSGLPQMLMLLIFSGCTYALVRALETRQSGKNTLGWIAMAGALFGLLALTHGLTAWMFFGALIFVAILFRPIGRDAIVLLAVFMLFYSPWMARNYKVCGSPFGLAPYSGLFQIRGTESSIMRSMMLNFSDVNPTTFRNKIQAQLIHQTGNLVNFLGKSLIAPVFFLALLHLFKVPLAGTFRWCILLMWLMAVAGMCTFGVNGEPGDLQANDLHILFVPLMIFYGLALVLIMWTRLDINVRLVRISFLVLIYVVSAVPLICSLISPPQGRVQWPPYVPPFIAILNSWTSDEEIIASDMPWGVAWYADRRSLWLPNTINDFMALNDYNQLGGRIVGLYLTPVSGNQPFVGEIMNGEYKDWAAFIMRNIGTLKDFPLRAVTPLPLNGECVFYSDRDRWSLKTD